MANKIGFSAEATEPTNKTKNHTEEFYRSLTKSLSPVKSLVEVYFPVRKLRLSYYNDQFVLSKGDIVFVEGKLEGYIGRVVNISQNFKIKISDYKRVIGVANTDVYGQFEMIGSNFLTVDPKALCANQVRTWFFPYIADENDYITCTNNASFYYDDLEKMDVSNEEFHEGEKYYMENNVKYITKCYHIIFLKLYATVNCTVAFTLRIYPKNLYTVFCVCYIDIRSLF